MYRFQQNQSMSPALAMPQTREHIAGFLAQVHLLCIILYQMYTDSEWFWS